jgi:hypothetical protein
VRVVRPIYQGRGLAVARRRYHEGQWVMLDSPEVSVEPWAGP